jgi:hypothetical protein
LVSVKAKKQCGKAQARVRACLCDEFRQQNIKIIAKIIPKYYVSASHNTTVIRITVTFQNPNNHSNGRRSPFP